MFIKQRALIIPVIVTFLIITVIGSLAGCSKEGAPSTRSELNLKEIHYISTAMNDAAAETDMLISGQADMIPAIRNLAEVEKLLGEKEITVSPANKGSFTISCIFFNLRRSPMNDQTFREAIAKVVNRDYLIKTLLNGMAAPCATFIPPFSDDWTNRQASAPAFDSKQAVQILDNAGYRFDKDLQSRIDPKTNKPLQLNILTTLQGTDPVLWDIGYMLTYYINGLGIKANHIAIPDNLFKTRAMQTRDFDILIQDIFLAQAPFGLYPLLHSSRDQVWTNAFPGIQDSALDADLERLWFGLDLQVAQKAAKDVQAQLAKKLPYLAVCSMPVYSAISGDWNGIVDMPGSGFSNIWTFESIHPADESKGGVIKLTAPGGFDSLNPLLADSASEWSVLQQIYSPLFYYDPVSMKDSPVLASKMDTEAWITSDGSNGMKVTFHLIDGVRWQDGVSFTSQDIKFCIDFIKSHNVSRFEDIMSVVDNVQAPDTQTVEIYLKDSGYRYLYDLAWFTFMPQHIWKDVTEYQSFKPWMEINPNNKELTNLVGQGPYILKPGNLTNGVQLYKNQTAHMVKQ